MHRKEEQTEAGLTRVVFNRFCYFDLVNLSRVISQIFQGTSTS